MGEQGLTLGKTLDALGRAEASFSYVSPQVAWQEILLQGQQVIDGVHVSVQPALQNQEEDLHKIFIGWGRQACISPARFPSSHIKSSVVGGREGKADEHRRAGEVGIHVGLHMLVLMVLCGQCATSCAGTSALLL